MSNDRYTMVCDACDRLLKVAKDDSRDGGSLTRAALAGGLGAAGTGALLHARNAADKTLPSIQADIKRSWASDRRWDKLKDMLIPGHVFVSNRNPSAKTLGHMNEYVNAVAKRRMLGALSAVPAVLGAHQAIKALRGRKKDD